MDKILKKHVDTMKNDYLKSKDKLKYDGDLLNHFVALVLTNSNKEFNYDKIRTIRKYIKDKTSWFSTFRGNNLYIISILLSLKNDWKDRFERILIWEDKLKEEGFIESPYLSVGIWILTDYFEDEELYTVSLRMKQVFALIKDRYSNVTSSDDYIMCAILVSLGLDNRKNIDIADKCYDKITSEDIISNNGAQTLSNIICTDPENYINNLDKAIEICEIVRGSVGSVQPQYAGIIGIASILVHDVNKFMREVQTVETYLSETHEYEFFMDKSFRLMISMFMVIISKKHFGDGYLNSIIALTINYCLVSQQQAMIYNAN
ncbi:DUF4003 family protein [Clostridium sp. C8-1-8]|uniref:DUF4003 family protein n=1 Tax=Clostridium sp. C8-1-8 TaxID=2698831 RepID=UPI00136912FD|nr:DUF4003 family protein [Clostridium sp. C8-1-8]